MKIRLLLTVAVAIILLAGSPSSAQENTVIDHLALPALNGTQIDPAKYDDKVLLIVNVASKCGLTPQYSGLQALHEKYAGQGLAVLGFPCNQFGGQEPGDAEQIRDFCETNYGVDFDLFAKVAVNGDEAVPLYKFLKAQPTQPTGPGEIAWNFEKFLIGRDGEVIARFSPRTQPNDPELVKAIEAALQQS